MTRILWLNRHRPKQEQVKALKDYFGDVEVVERVIGFDTDPSVGIDQIQEVMRETNADEIVAVVPITHVAELTRRGIYPLRAIMKREPLQERNHLGEIEFEYIFEGFERILEASIQTKYLAKNEVAGRDRKKITVVDSMP